MNLKSLTEELPPQNEPIIVETRNDRAQCEIRGDSAYKWATAYPEGRATIFFSKVIEITGWRRCSGFDY